MPHHQDHRSAHHKHSGGGSGRHHDSGGGGHHGGMGAGVAPDHSGRKLPFLWGTQEQRIPIATIPFVAGAKAPTVRIPKNGYLSKLLFRFIGNANVTVAGTARVTPPIWNLISQYVLSYNGGFQYRNMDGESMLVMNMRRCFGADVITNGPTYKTYTVTSVTNQTIGFIIEDEVNLNTQVNADKYLLAAQARNADITLDITFDSGGNVSLSNGETVAFSGTLFVEGLYLLDPPDYVHFDEPNLRKVQQILTDTSYTNLVIGDNTVPIVPVNGPKYLDILFLLQYSRASGAAPVVDTQGFSTSCSRVQLKINNGLNRYDMSSQALAQENCRQLGRASCMPALATNAALPPGWYMMNFLDDASINNAVSMVGRNVISTEKIANLWLIPTIASGTVIGSGAVIKLIKRAELPAVGGTNRGPVPLAS